VRNLVFKDLVFQYANRDTWEKEDIGLQHDWELYNKSNAVFRMVGVENCMIDGCRFTKCGNTAVRLDLYCQNNRIINNEISNMVVPVSYYADMVLVIKMLIKKMKSSTIIYTIVDYNTG